jgi:hypothetical protein
LLRRILLWGRLLVVLSERRRCNEEQEGSHHQAKEDMCDSIFRAEAAFCHDGEARYHRQRPIQG